MVYHYGMYYCMYNCVFVLHWHAFLRRPWVFPRALGGGARQGAACTPRPKFGPPGDSVARALGVLSREIWLVITGVLSAELEPSKLMGNPYASHCCKAQQHGNNNRFNISLVLQLRPLLLLCVRGPLIYMCGRPMRVCVVCALRVRVRVCTGLSMPHASTRCSVLGRKRTAVHVL